MAQIVYSDEAFEDLERIVEFQLENFPGNALEVLQNITSAIDILATHPLIGRRVHAHIRELVISWGTSGYLGLYRFDPTLDIVRVLRIRHQREAGYLD